MSISFELLTDEIISNVTKKLKEIEFDAQKIADTKAIVVLSEIQEVIKNDALSDFETIEEIVCIFEKHRLDFGVRHDFS